MKPSAQDWEGQDLDKLLFDHLEGDLPEAMTKELEQRAASDALLSSEMEYWKETIVSGDLYDTSHLEQKLLMVESTPASQVEKVATHKVPSRYLLVWLMGMGCLWPVKLDKEIGRIESAQRYWPGVEAKVGTRVVLAEPVPAKENLIKEAAIPEKSLVVVSSPSITRMDKSVIAEIKQLTLLPLSIPQEIQEVTMLESATKKLIVKKIPVPRIISRKKARQIARMKERALQRRMANEFLKGRVPYVVPLNTRNF